jgi:putative transposase
MYAIIERHQKIFTATRICQLMDVSQSAYSDWQQRPESIHSIEDKRLGEKVKARHEKSRGTYGARQMLKDLLDGEESISRTRVGRLMK